MELQAPQVDFSSSYTQHLIQRASAADLHRSKEQFTDIRLKFHVNFQKVKEYVAKDLRVADDAKKDANLDDIPQGTFMRGVYGYRELFVRPQKSGKLAPYTCGLSAYAKDVEFHPNPDDSYILAD